MTGAARNALRVKTPAVAQLVVLTSSATSSAPSDFRPSCVAAAVNPRGDVTEPSGTSVNAEGMAGLPRECLAACLMTDAERYTALTEAMEPSAVVEMINRYFDALFGPVLKNGGMISDVKDSWPPSPNVPQVFAWVAASVRA